MKAEDRHPEITKEKGEGLHPRTVDVKVGGRRLDMRIDGSGGLRLDPTDENIEDLRRLTAARILGLGTSSVQKQAERLRRHMPNMKQPTIPDFPIQVDRTRRRLLRNAL